MIPITPVPTAPHLDRLAFTRSTAALPAYPPSAIGSSAEVGRLAPSGEPTAVGEGGTPRPADVIRRIGGNLRFTLGIHRPLDGPMKQRTVGTLSVIVRP